jgi:FlaA1/EpsC-like NDP-sugar epimerase
MQIKVVNERDRGRLAERVMDFKNIFVTGGAGFIGSALFVWCSMKFRAALLPTLMH